MLASNLEPDLALLGLSDDKILSCPVDVLRQLNVASAPIRPRRSCRRLVLALLVSLGLMAALVLEKLWHFCLLM